MLGTLDCLYIYRCEVDCFIVYVQIGGRDENKSKKTLILVHNNVDYILKEILQYRNVRCDFNIYIHRLYVNQI